MVVILFIAGLGIGFFILLAQPNPTVATVQGVVPGDTVPLYYTRKTELPEGGSGIWYESLTVMCQNCDAKASVLVFFGNSNSGKPCLAPSANIHTESKTATSEVNQTHIVLTEPFYLTIGATLSLNFTVHSSPSNVTLQVTVLDSINEYNCLSDHSCSVYNPKSYTVSPGTQKSFNQDISISSYYYIVFSSTKNISFSYTYEITSHYYNYTDYSDRIQSCTVPEVKACTLNIVGNNGECAFAYSAASDIDLIFMKVVAHHRRFNIISIVFLALFVASLSLLFACLLSVFVLQCLKRYNNKSGYRKLI